MTVIYLQFLLFCVQNFCTDLNIPTTYNLVSCILNNFVCSHGKHFYRTDSRTIFCCTECGICLLTPQKHYAKHMFIKHYASILLNFVSPPAFIAKFLIVPAYSLFLFCGTVISFAILTGANRKTPEQLRLFHTVFCAFLRLNKQTLTLACVYKTMAVFRRQLIIFLIILYCSSNWNVNKNQLLFEPN